KQSAISRIPAFSVWSTTVDLGTSATALAEGRTDIALVAGRSAAERSPWWPEPWHSTSRAARQAGELAEARAAAERAIAADPLDRQGWFLLIEIDQTEDLDAVGEHLAELRQIDPNGLDLHLNVLRYARATDDDDLAQQAAAVIEQVIDEDNPRWEEYQTLLSA
ncbi:MAG: tetratricopeptide repeat protein, partial [Nitriliruptoraceae bacterium]